MRKISFLMAFLLFVHHGFSASVPVLAPLHPLTAKDLMIPLQGTNQSITLEQYLQLTPGTYKLLTGKKMSFREKVELKVRKHLLKKAIRKDGSAHAEKMKGSGFFGGWSWHWGGFALGLFLFIGPIIALFFNDEYKWDRFWTALHTSLWLTLIGVAIAAAIAGA